MTKKLLTFMTGGLLMACTAAYAQPTLTATGCNPTLGESYTLKTAAFESEGGSGPNQTWNLAMPGGVSGGLISVVAPSSTPNGSSFTNASIALSNTSSGTILYQKTSGTSAQNYGFVGGGTVSPYSNPEDMIRFPFNYTNTYSDNWAGQFVSGGNTFFRSGKTTVTADAYGTLTTPNGTYTNVMRVHFLQEYKDSTDLGGFPFEIFYQNDQYMWYKDGVHAQLATVFTLESDVSAPVTGSNYLSGNTSGLSMADNVIASSNLYPNPATDKINIEFVLADNKRVDILIFNELGQRMDFRKTLDGLNGENSTELDVAALTAGVYFANIIVEGKIVAKQKFVKG